MDSDDLGPMAHVRLPEGVDPGDVRYLPLILEDPRPVPGAARPPAPLVIELPEGVAADDWLWMEAHLAQRGVDRADLRGGVLVIPHAAGREAALASFSNAAPSLAAGCGDWVADDAYRRLLELSDDAVAEFDQRAASAGARPVGDDEGQTPADLE